MHSFSFGRRPACRPSASRSPSVTPWRDAFGSGAAGLAGLAGLLGAAAIASACGGSSASSTSTPPEDGGGTTAEASVPVDSGTAPHDAGGGKPTDAAVGGHDSGLPVGSVGPNGGQLSTLNFAVTGDSRPPTSNDIQGYPTAVVTKIFQQIEALSPRPDFVVGTGDYQYSSPTYLNSSAQQMMLYMSARASFTGPFFPAMGNHECTGADDSNCGAGSSSGTTANLKAFLSAMLAPIQKTEPYYAFDIDAIDGSWTSKFVVTAPNAWDSTQQAWLTTQMARSTTYTFVVRHQPSTSSGNPPGVAAIDTILGSYPYTLMLQGHSHTHKHSYVKVVLFGNGGAPLDLPSDNYGFGTVQRRADGNLVVDAVDEMTGMTESAFHFVITPGGTLTK